MKAADDTMLQLRIPRGLRCSCAIQGGCAVAVTATGAALQRWQRLRLCCSCATSCGSQRGCTAVKAVEVATL